MTRADLLARMTLRNTHGVAPDRETNVVGDVLVASPRRSMAQPDVLGLVVHLLQAANLTVEDVADGLHELEMARCAAVTLRAALAEPGVTISAEAQALLHRLGPDNERPTHGSAHRQDKP